MLSHIIILYYFVLSYNFPICQTPCQNIWQKIGSMCLARIYRNQNAFACPGEYMQSAKSVCMPCSPPHGARVLGARAQAVRHAHTELRQPWNDEVRYFVPGLPPHVDAFRVETGPYFVPGLLFRSRRDTVRRVGGEISTGQRWRQQYEEHSLNRARFWPHAGNHTEPWEETRNRAYFYARDSDLPKPPVQKSAR